MIKRATTEVREVFYPNREATEQLHKVIPNSKEYRICKVFLEVPILYYHIPVYLQTHSVLNRRDLSLVHFSDQELCICKEWGIYEIPSRKRMDEFKAKLKRKRISVIVEVLEEVKKPISIASFGYIELGSEDFVEFGCRVSLFVLLEHYDISPELKYCLNEDGKYAILNLEYSNGIRSLLRGLPIPYEEGDIFYSFNVLKKEVRSEIGTIIRTYLKSK